MTGARYEIFLLKLVLIIVSFILIISNVGPRLLNWSSVLASSISCIVSYSTLLIIAVKCYELNIMIGHRFLPINLVYALEVTLLDILVFFYCMVKSRLPVDFLSWSTSELLKIIIQSMITDPTA